MKKNNYWWTTLSWIKKKKMLTIELEKLVLRFNPLKKKKSDKSESEIRYFPQSQNPVWNFLTEYEMTPS